MEDGVTPHTPKTVLNFFFMAHMKTTLYRFPQLDSCEHLQLPCNRDLNPYAHFCMGFLKEEVNTNRSQSTINLRECQGTVQLC
jgi:hypothetical protein